MSTKLRIVLLAAVLGPLLGCASGARFEGLGAEGEFLNGKELYESGRCFQAAEALQAFLAQHPGSSVVDEAIFYLGLSRKCLGEYILAREEFDRLLREFPQSENREEAEWNRALCFHESRHSADRDPEPTEQSIRAFEAYLQHYPEGVHREEATRYVRESVGRLAEKAYENGRTYLMLREYAAAAIYFRSSLEIQPDSHVAPRAHRGLVQAHLDAGDLPAAQAALEAFRQFAGGDAQALPGTKLQEELRTAEELMRTKGAFLEKSAGEQAAGGGG